MHLSSPAIPAGLKSQRALVTGGAGFIGSRLVDLLLDAGTEVMVADNFSTGRREFLERPGTGKLEVIEADIRSAGDLHPVAEFAPDTVFHMAALAVIPYCNAHPQETLDVNVLGLDTVIRSVRGAPLNTFVFASSSAVYGLSDDLQPDGMPPSPAQIYGISKWMGEQVMACFHTDRPEVRTVIARLFSTCGSPETNPHVLPEIMKSINERRATEPGGRCPERDPIFVTAAAAGILAAAAGRPGLTILNVVTMMAESALRPGPAPGTHTDESLGPDLWY